MTDPQPLHPLPTRDQVAGLPGYREAIAEAEHSVLAELLGRMKRDGLITQDKKGNIRLRMYGKEALAMLRTIRDHEDFG